MVTQQTSNGNLHLNGRTTYCVASSSRIMLCRYTQKILALFGKCTLHFFQLTLWDRFQLNNFLHSIKIYVCQWVCKTGRTWMTPCTLFVIHDMKYLDRYATFCFQNRPRETAFTTITNILHSCTPNDNNHALQDSNGPWPSLLTLLLPLTLPPQNITSLSDFRENNT